MSGSASDYQCFDKTKGTSIHCFGIDTIYTMYITLWFAYPRRLNLFGFQICGFETT